MKLEWEVLNEIKEDNITSLVNTLTQRLKVHGGWIVERWESGGISYHYFLEDPDHLWGEPGPEVEEGVTTCPDCKKTALLFYESGKRCLACKQRWCKKCNGRLTTEDLTEKCLKCGFVNEWATEK